MDREKLLNDRLCLLSVSFPAFDTHHVTRVEWDTYFKGGTWRDNDMVSVRLTTNFERPLNTIWCQVPLSEYRELGVLPEGSKVRVMGKIPEAGPWDIKLEEVHPIIFGKQACPA